ncbi:hypothetical protein D3C74_397970 [compost metagenome]
MAPRLITGNAVEINVNAGTMTSSPSFTLKLLRRRSIALVPFVTPSAYLALCISANIRSNSFTFVPVMRHHWLLYSASSSSFSSLSVAIGQLGNRFVMLLIVNTFHFLVFYGYLLQTICKAAPKRSIVSEDRQ